MSIPENHLIFILLKQFSCVIFLLFSLEGRAQETALLKQIKTVQQLLNSVEANKLTYNQNLKTVTPGYYDYTVIKVNDKGQEEETIYSFGFSDINSRSVRSFTKKDIILIELVVNGKKKLIKRTVDDGAKIDYISDFTMYGLNADNGRDIEKAIEDAIPEAILLDEKALSLSSFQDHIKWLEDNISNVTLPKDRIMQQLTVDSAKPTFIILEQIEGSKKKRYEFNISLLNTSSVQYKISGDEFAIEVGTKKGMNAVKYFEDGVLEDYTDNIIFYASSLSNGKNIHRVLKGIVPLSEEEFEASKPDVTSIPKSLQYLNDHIGNITSNERMTWQSLELNENMASVLIKETVGGKDEEHRYVFNLSDINTSGISFNSRKTRLFLELATSGGRPYIGNTENGQLENYEKTLLLYFSSMDEAIVGKDAFKFLIESYDDNASDGDVIPNIPLEEAVKQLKTQIGTVNYGDDQVEQYLELLETETSTLKLTRRESKSKKSIEIVFEFSVLDINKQGIKVEVSGKRVWVELVAKGAEKVIKVYEDGQVQNYRNRVVIEALDIENAKAIVRIFERLVESQSK